MTRNILILLAFILVAATPVWTPLVTDSTITGIGTSDSPLKIDTTKIATRYYSGSLTGGASYTAYTALLTQSGTDAPTATVLENTLGTVSFTYDDVGSYIVSCTSCFTADKSIAIAETSQGSSDVTFIIGGFVSTTQLYIYSLDSGVNTDDVLVNRWIEIRVYP